MDLAFEILLPVESDLDLLQFKAPVFEWDGVVYPQGPPEAKFGEHFRLVMSPIPDFVLRELPTAYRKLDLQCIAIWGEGVDLYRSYLMGFVEEEPVPSLSDLITTLIYNRDYWVVNFEPEFDGVAVSQAGTIEDVMAGIDYSLKVDKRGFLFWKDVEDTGNRPPEIFQPEGSSWASAIVNMFLRRFS